MLSVRELKHRYKILRAKDQALPLEDMGFPLPLSTGSPFLDSMLNERIKNTAMMNEEEHLMRSWQLVQNASEAEFEMAMQYLDGFLFDHNLLFAVALFERGDERYKTVLTYLPQKWQFQFPIALIKPSSAFFSGWRRDIPFRLVKEIDYPSLKQHYHQILNEAGDSQILKFRRILKESLALLHWAPEGEKEKAIHEWCFGKGRPSDEIPLVSNYIGAREKAKQKNEMEFLKELESHEKKIPLTSLMGLFSMFNIHLSLDVKPGYRDYAVATATPVEAILRFREWGSWLQSEHIDEISKKVTGISGQNIPFFKIVNAYLAAHSRLRYPLFDKIYVPLMKRFSNRMAKFIPEGTEMILLQPNCFVNVMSLLFLTTISYDRSTRVILIGEESDELDNKTILNYDKLREVLLKPRREIEEFLLKEFGGQALRYSWRFDDKVTAAAFDSFTTDDMLILDLPFVFSTRILERLLHMNRVLNLAGTFGSPSEISLRVRYKPTYAYITRDRGFFGYERFSSTSVSNLAGFIERLDWFNNVGGDVEC